MKKLAFGFAAVAAVAALGACTKKTEPAADAATTEAPAAETATAEDAADGIEKLATVDPDAPEASGGERFYGKKEFTIVSKQTGVEAGDITEHVRDWGRRRVEIKRTTLSIAGQSILTDTRVVTDGSSIATINNDTGAIATTTNPMYDTIVARMKGRSGVEVGKEMMTEMGGRETGEKGSFAGHDCDYWELQSLARRPASPLGAALCTCRSAWAAWRSSGQRPTFALGTAARRTRSSSTSQRPSRRRTSPIS